MTDKKFVGQQLTRKTIDNRYLRKETIIDNQTVTAKRIDNQKLTIK